MELKFFKCEKCGNVIVKLVDSGVVPVCCGEEMHLLDPKEKDGANEKHMPVLTATEDGHLHVEVSTVAHPMLPEHHICFIAVETKSGMQVAELETDKPAIAEFNVDPAEVTGVYEYCNLHGLWKAE